MTDPAGPDPLDLRPLPGSERAPAPGLTSYGAVPPDTEITVTLVLRRQAPVPQDLLSNPISPEDFANRYGASTSDLDVVTQTLTGLGAHVTSVDAASRRVLVTGTAAVLSRIFGVTLTEVASKAPSGQEAEHRHRVGQLSVPAALDGIVVAVLGLDDRPQSRPQFRMAAAETKQEGYRVPDIGSIYRFPAGTDGTGQTIAIIELGGGYAQADLDSYFSGLGLATPNITSVSVDGASNGGGQDPKGFDREALLDIDVVGALAPKADIVVYFAPNTDAGLVNAISQAVQASPTPIAISISWCSNEDKWTEQAHKALDAALVDACVLGITATAAAGDHGSSEQATDGRPHADFPASSPHALSCGGTTLSADPATGLINSETVWNNDKGASGGGVSDVFPLPPWQANVNVPKKRGKAGRGVPDVAAVADPHTGYRVRVGGQDTTMGGTSAVAPLWAALIARLAQATGRRFGLIQPALYGSTPAGAVAPGFRDITVGDIGAYQARAGWDACTGLGVPDGTALLALLQAPPAGNAPGQPTQPGQPD
ncbi:MAG TPA: S53 family peptidase [Jatrophihabitans sp.]|nr:S53 family peptidase [Jatrophihabitans sp.]